MKLILIRHAESIGNVLGILQGQKIDLPLSKLGKTQAKKLANYLKKEKIEAIYSSDLKRAMHTAQIIAKSHKLRVIPDKRLREKDHHNNEPQEHHVQRGISFMKDVINHKGNIIAVSHGGTNLILMAISTGNRKKGAKLYNKIDSKIGQANACINILHHKNNNWKIHTINKVVHKRKV